MNNYVDFFAENDLQIAIALNPDLLLPCAVEAASGSYLLITRDSAIRTVLDGTMGQPPDAIFVDSTGRCFIVEAKLSYNGDLRRKVIGQAIDYVGALLIDGAAVALRDAFLRRCEIHNIDPAIQIDRAFHPSITSDLWTRVAERLRHRDIHIVIAADKLPVEVVRACHALDQIMGIGSASALEVKKFIVDNEIKYSSRRVNIDEYIREPMIRAQRTMKSGKSWSPLPTFERNALDVSVEPRTKLVPLPTVFRMELSNRTGARDRHQVDPSRPASHIGVMPNLDLVKRGLSPYPNTIDSTVRTGEIWKPWIEIARVTWDYLNNNGEVVCPRDSKIICEMSLRNDPRLAQDANFAKNGGQGVRDTLRDLQLYGLCRAFQKGASLRFVRESTMP